MKKAYGIKGLGKAPSKTSKKVKKTFPFMHPPVSSSTQPTPPPPPTP